VLEIPPRADGGIRTLTGLDAKEDPMPDLLHHLGRWRRGTFVVAGLTVGAVAVVAAGIITGSAQAGQTRPEITANTVAPTIGVTLPPFTFVTVPPFTLVTSPPLTFVTVPGSTTIADTTTTAETTTTSESTTTLQTDTSTTEAQTEQDALPTSEYTLVIDLAQVNCDGTIHVEYATTADPAPATLANHIVMYNPTGSPTAFTVVETADNAPNGSFVFDGPGAPDLTYRVFVIGLFDPVDPDGPKVIDQADVALVDGC
jgi:hypothetical protein